MNAYLAYNKRSSVTGKILWEYLKENKVGGFNWRHCCANDPRAQADLFVRWGNSLLATPNGAKEINTKEAVSNASDKLKMMRILVDTDGVKIPEIQIFADNAYAAAGVDADKKFFRNAHDQIAFRANHVAGDKYCLAPVEKTHEYRVHIFNEKTLGIYEKVPHEGEDGLIRKDANCDFVRRDMANDQYRNQLKGARPMAVAAVKALGLVFGGVDIIKDANGNWYVLEVNSAPALNEPNIERWCNAFGQFVNNGEANAAPQANPAQDQMLADRRAEEEARLKAEVAQREKDAIIAKQNEVRMKVNALVQREGLALAEPVKFAKV